MLMSQPPEVLNGTKYLNLNFSLQEILEKNQKEYKLLNLRKFNKYRNYLLYLYRKLKFAH